MERRLTVKPLNLLRSVQPFIAAAAVIATAAVLVVAIYFTLLDLAWIAFLGGVLVAGLLAVVTRATRAEYVAVTRGAKLAVSEDRLSHETDQREKLEAMLGRANAMLQFSDELLPAMVAFVDAEGIYRYHNHAFRRWLDLPPHRIDGHHMREALGRVVYAQVEADVLRALSGETVRYQRTQKIATGAVFRLNAQLLPVRDARGKPNGFFAVMTDITEGNELRPPEAAPAVARAADGAGPPATSPAKELSDQLRFDAALAEQATGLPDARERILAAIERNEFSLYCQLIEPLDTSSGRPRHYEILIRLLEEEANMIPPGAFFPLAEEYGLLPQLDRWVVTHLLQWIAGREPGTPGRNGESFFINIAIATLCDPDFPEHVAQQLNKFGLPGDVLCFEITESELTPYRSDVDAFVRGIRPSGCKLALSGFGRDRVTVGVFKELPLDYLKIDGSVILNIHKDAFGMNKLIAIHRVASAVGIPIVAEMVEDAATIASLRRITVEYGQGFGISRPAPLADLR